MVLCPSGKHEAFHSPARHCLCNVCNKGTIGSYWCRACNWDICFPCQTHRTAPPAGMDASAFEKLKAQVAGESFSSGKIGVIKVAASANKFTPQQVLDILNILNFSSDKISAAELLIPKLTSKDQAHIILSCSTFDSDKQKIQALLSH